MNNFLHVLFFLKETSHIFLLYYDTLFPFSISRRFIYYDENENKLILFNYILDLRSAYNHGSSSQIRSKL